MEGVDIVGVVIEGEIEYKLNDNGFVINGCCFYANVVCLFQVISGEAYKMIGGVDVIFRLSTVMCFTVSLPSDQVLALLLSTVEPCIQHLFYFVLMFSIDKIRWWFFKVRTMFFCLLIR
jgi:hypothetical protein